MIKDRRWCLLIAGFAFLTSCGSKTDGDDDDGMPPGGDTSEDKICAEGENPQRDGCELACTDGWHDGVGGGCVADCPPLMVEQEDGSCELSCQDGALEMETTVPSKDSELFLQYCVPGCPEGMELVDGSCDLSCGEGWFRDEDGECHLSCPEGMVATKDDLGCALETVGESKVCPDGKWDTTIQGPSPLFVDPVDGSEAGDGSRESPFATINQAVGAMGDAATLYLAPGEYDEQVIVDGKEAVTIVGRCAADVVVAPSTMVDTYPKGEEGESAGAITTLKVDSIRVHGVTVRSPGRNGIVIRHGASDESPETARIDQVIVDSAAMSGVLIRGAYDETEVSDTSVTAGQIGLNIGPQGDSDDVFEGVALPTGVVDIERNRITGLELYDDTLDVFGVFVIAAKEVTAAGNRIENIEYATGINLWLVTDAVVEKNLLTNIRGYGGMHFIGPMKADVPMTAVVQDNIVHNISVGPCNLVASCSNIVWGVDFDTANGTGAYAATFYRNRVERVQGYAVGMGTDEITGSTLDISESEITRSSIGIGWSSGDLSVTGTRLYRNWNAVSGGGVPGAAPVGDMLLKGNLFADREEDPAGMPDTDYKKLLPGSVVFFSNSARRSDMRVIGNLFRNNRVFESDPGLIVLNLFGEKVLLENNVFSENSGIATWIGGGSLTARDNQYVDNEEGLRVVQAAGEAIPAAAIRDNFFSANRMGLLGAWMEETGEYTIKGNTFLASDAVIGDYGSAGQNAKSVHIAENYFGAARVQAGSTDRLRIDGNLFEESRVAVAGQPEDSTADIVDNLFQRAFLEVYQVDSTLRIENNSLEGPARYVYSGAGITVLESPGPVQIVHNLIGRYEAEEVPGIGTVGDGIQIVGFAPREPSQVWIESNRIDANTRFGALVVNAEGNIEGNMFAGNGTGSADDLVFSPPQGDGCKGADVEFATVLEAPPAVLDSETILSHLITLQ